MEETQQQGEESAKQPSFRDIRRYYCEYCGVCRSKKSLISMHIIKFHQKEMDENDGEDNIEETAKTNTCQECGANFKKPAYLKQHMLSHSVERPFMCPVDGCHSSYRRKDHLTRHLLQHEGNVFKCSNEKCARQFVSQANLTRHKCHEPETPFSGCASKQHVCQEDGCGKAFRFASKLQKHELSHVKLETMEAICLETGCLKYFSNEACLKAHMDACHQHINCEVCGSKQLKKNLKRHLRTHEPGHANEPVKCNFEGCLHTFSNRSNLQQHVKAVHLNIKRFACGYADCGMKFAYKHVRDNHEKTSHHVYTQGDFLESLEHCRVTPCGGRKRKCPSIASVLVKRITPHPKDSDSTASSMYSAWMNVTNSE
uniref:C2H2-type domain-containing protein n=2 Tax=Kalanchoe fedtschenkoi TaxID=63787 RepID=A0A7N0US59_KALFE